MKTYLWQLGFRPFFLFGSVFAVVTMLLWIGFLTGHLAQLGSFPPMLWHPHEMIYGFATAIVAGFVLTASQNWTGMRGVHGTPLIALTLVWGLARLLLAIPGVSPLLAAVVDLAFLPFLGALLFPFLRQPDARAERVFYIFFALLFVGNALVHLEVLGWLPGYGRKGIFLGLNTILLIVIFIGGRVIPFFTESSVARAQPRVRRSIEIASYLSAAAYLVTDFVSSGGRLHTTLAIAAAGIHFARLLGWQVRRVRRIPLIWILHLGYFWLVLGFALSALSSTGLVATTLATHAFTIGGLGVIVYGMLSRVSLGHTGRRLHPSAWVVAGYVSLNLAALVRTAGPIAWPGLYQATLVVSGALWIIAFVIYIAVYSPMLLSKRVDGKAG